MGVRFLHISVRSSASFFSSGASSFETSTAVSPATRFISSIWRSSSSSGRSNSSVCVAKASPPCPPLRVAERGCDGRSLGPHEVHVLGTEQVAQRPKQLVVHGDSQRATPQSGGVRTDLADKHGAYPRTIDVCLLPLPHIRF